MDSTGVLSLSRTLLRISHISVIWCRSVKLYVMRYVCIWIAESDWYKCNLASLSLSQDLPILVCELCECDGL
jgi:hypothetical protein